MPRWMTPAKDPCFHAFTYLSLAFYELTYSLVTIKSSNLSRRRIAFKAGSVWTVSLQNAGRFSGASRSNASRIN